MTNYQTKNEIYNDLKSANIHFSDNELHKMASIIECNNICKIYNDVCRDTNLNDDYANYFVKKYIEDGQYDVNWLNEQQKITNSKEYNILHACAIIVNLENKEIHSYIDEILLSSCVKQLIDVIKLVDKFDYIHICPCVRKYADILLEKYNPHKKAGRKTSEKKILCYDKKSNTIIKEYNNVYEIIKDNSSLNKSGISQTLNGKRKSYKGFVFKYK